MIIDAHFHMGTLYRSEAPGDTFWGAERVIARMDAHSVDKAVVQSASAFNLRANNDLINQELKKGKGRLIGSVRVNPNDKENCLQEIDMRIKQQGWKMIKLHPSLQCFPIDSEIAFPVFEKARELKVPVHVHACSDIFNTPAQVAIVAELFPDVTILLAHMGFSALNEQSILAARLRPNIILETAIQCMPAIIKEAVRVIGPERVVFGSDSPYVPIEMGLNVIKAAGLTRSEEEWVLGKSMQAILDKIPSYEHP